MEVEINPGSQVSLSDALAQHIHERADHVATHFHGDITRLEVYLEDVNGPKGGVDKHCVMEAHAAGLAPAAAKSQNEDLYHAVKLASQRLEKALAKQAGKQAARAREY